MDVLHEVLAHKLVPVVVIDSASDAEPLAAALVEGGLPVAEVTFRTSAAPAAIKKIKARGDVLVGAGTVIDAAQVDQAITAGAQFVVSPGLSPDVVAACRAAGVPVLPGAVTATEIQAALALGIDTVKFFPAETFGGVAGVRALSAPFPQVRFVPTGGISKDNLADYLSLPAVPAVGGSWMVAPALVRAGRFDEIARLAEEAVHTTQVAQP